MEVGACDQSFETPPAAAPQDEEIFFAVPGASSGYGRPELPKRDA
jgi:hypothetical protein